MPSISFVEPQLLWLFLLLPLVWMVGLTGHTRLSPRRRIFSLGLRTVIAIGLVLAISGAQLALPLSTTTTVFLLDTSDSVALSQRATAEGFVQQALAAMPPDDQSGIIVFGARPLVEREPSSDHIFGQVTALPPGGATDLAAALRLGTALLPSEGGRRMVLLSDGGETTGNAIEAARLAAASGIPIDIVPLSATVDGIDARITAVELPASIRAGQRPQMRIGLESNQAVTARLTVDGPGGVLVDQPIELTGGPLVLDITLPEPPTSFNRYVVRLAVENDVRSENNAAEAFTFVAGLPRVLLIEGATGEASQLALALTAAGLEATMVAPGAAPRQVAELATYDVVVLVNVVRRDLPEQTASAISICVHELGRGLLMVGGPQSFGAGGWRDTPVEAALPVTMDIPSLLQIPPVSVVVVIDTSGSMAAEEHGRTKLSLAVEGAQRIASLLRDEDELTVIPFDSAPQHVVGPLPGSRRQEVINELEQVEVGGGGIDIHNALVEAAKTIRASKHPVRHIITITDGDDTVQQEGAIEIVNGLRAEGVTLTTIAIGQGKDVAFLQGAASAGGGRTFLTEQASNLPTILVDETQAVLRPYIVERDFTPALGAPHPALQMRGEAPPLHGLVLTTPKDTAQILLSDKDGQALLVAWQYGLGRSLAWTSDMTGRWGRDWVGWDQFPDVASQLVAWLLPSTDLGALSLEAQSASGSLELDARAEDARGAAWGGLQVQAQLYGANGQRFATDLHEVSPGRYHTTISNQPPGAYLVQLIAADQSGAPVAILTAGAVVPLSAEYAGQTANPALLQELARLTGGRISPEPEASFAPTPVVRGATREIGLWLLWLALALLPVDIAVRRLLWRRPALQPSRAPQPAPPQPAPPQPATDRPPKRSSKEEELARLREAQEQARKRARGEE